MSGELERRWDTAVETAWREFRQRLADRLASMADGEALVVELPQESAAGAAPYCQAMVDHEWLRIEAVSNVYLDEGCRLDEAQAAALVALGFTRPDEADPDDGAGRTNFWADLVQRDADRAAVMMVRALREVYAVVHPVYLRADGLQPVAVAFEQRHVAAPSLEDPLVPRSPDDVRGGVDRALDGICDEAPVWDEDGDLAIATSRGVVWVTVPSAAPRLLLHAVLVEDVVDELRAVTEVNLLNQQEFGLTFTVHDGRISVFRELDVRALVPAHLREEIQRLRHRVDRWAEDLVVRVGGRCLDETAPHQPQDRPDAPEQGRFQAAYAVLQELESQERGSVDPAAMTRIFQQDTGLVLKAIRVTESRLRDWQRRERDYLDAGNDSAVQVARIRQQVHRDVRSRLRQALRLIVDAPVRKVQLDQLALFDEDECGTGQ